MLRRALFTVLLFFAFVAMSCGAGDDSSSESSRDPICNCTAANPESSDYRHAAKHVNLPGGTAEDTSMEEILSWSPISPEPSHEQARSNRENQLFHIPRAYLQFAWQNSGDCDLHLEISETTSKTAPRIIVETPIEESYCSARIALKNALKTLQDVELGPNSGEITPVPIEVRGLAFQDRDHKRGTDMVKTVWELHPAVVTVLPQ